MVHAAFTLKPCQYVKNLPLIHFPNLSCMLVGRYAPSHYTVVIFMRYLSVVLALAYVTLNLKLFLYVSNIVNVDRSLHSYHLITGESSLIHPRSFFKGKLRIASYSIKNRILGKTSYVIEISYQLFHTFYLK